MSRSHRYAARLNAFKLGADLYWHGKNQITTIDLLERASSSGLNAADLNFPDHLEDQSAVEIRQAMDTMGMKLNGFAMRYYTDPGFKLGAFTHPDKNVRQAAIDVTLRGIDTLVEMGGNLMTLWMGQDGWDYSFQADYNRLWDHTIECIGAVADHAPEVDIAIEYKVNEPRAFSLIPDVATTLLAIKEVDRRNVGVTLDFAHVLYADEMPAHTASLIARHTKLMGVHLNDGYAKRDDGLMVGSVHIQQTIELLVELIAMDYSGAIYFDTFPDHSGLDPVEEAKTNLAAMENLWPIAENLASNQELKTAIELQNATLSQRIVQAAILGGR